MLFSYEPLPILNGNNPYIKTHKKIVILELRRKCTNGVLTA